LTRPTAAAAATTSPLAEEGEEEPAEDATLISRTAEQAGLTAERMRQAGDRLRGQGPMPLPHRRRRGLKIAAAVGVAAIILFGLFNLNRQVYFLGTDDDGRVALFRGLPYELPLGINLYSEQLSIGVPAASLSPERQEVVTEHKLRSEDDARDIVADIEDREGSQPLTPPTTTTPAPGTENQKKKKNADAQGGGGGAN
jgi:protein phosphatase